MDVRLTLLGSMMLLWAHILFLVDLAGRLENLRTRQIVIRRSGGDGGGRGNGEAPERDGGDVATAAGLAEKDE